MSIGQSSDVKHRDETYILDLCDKVLGHRRQSQHKFEFLEGDSGRKLPVDAYYPELNLVIEYRERQHSEAVPHFDKRSTVSGVPRGEQRKLYDDLRRQKLRSNGIDLVELNYSDFPHDGRKRLRRVPDQDEVIVRAKLAKWISTRRSDK
jgi:hypothetical protein